jgi:HEPN domain-containing protein
MSSFVRDPSHWLFKMDPHEWIRAALVELRRAETLYRERNAGGGLAGARRAAGMAINAAIIVSPDEAYGRSFVDHLRALVDDAAVPEAVRDAGRVLLETRPPGPTLVILRSAKADERVLEAARDVVAHGYARVLRSEPLEPEER